MIAGIDVGYGFLKAVSEERRVLFPALIGPGEASDFDAGLGDAGGLTIGIDGTTAFIGERAALHGRWVARTISRERVGTKEAKLLFLAALVHLFPGGLGNGGLDVVTGLPVAWLRDRQAIQDSWIGSHGVRVNGKSLRYEVRSVEVVPQAFGTLIRQMFSEEGQVKDRELFDGNVGVGDWGTLTFNLLSFHKREYIPHESGSADVGVVRLLEVMQKRILDEFQLDLELHEVDEAVRAGAVTLYGQQRSLNSLLGPVVGSLVAESLALARSKWGDGRQKTHILLTGGGASLLGAAFAKDYGHPRCTIVHEPQWANAEGFLLRAKIKQASK